MSEDTHDPTRHEVWLTINEVCEELEVSRRTIYNWIAKGRIVVMRTPGGTIRIARSSLRREMEDSPWRR